MKSRIIIFVMFVLAMTGCKKEEGPGGKNTINGTVYFLNGVNGSETGVQAEVSIAYGTDQQTTSFNKTILSSSDGSYSFEGLQKGKYYLTAVYTDANGFVYKTNGATVTFNHRKKQASIELVLQ